MQRARSLSQAWALGGAAWRWPDSPAQAAAAVALACVGKLESEESVSLRGRRKGPGAGTAAPAGVLNSEG